MFKLIQYEIRNILGNFFIPLFGIVLPIFMGVIIPKSVADEVPKLFLQEVINTIILSMSVMIPLCVGLLGHAATYAQEVEKDIPLRMQLFGLNKQKIITSKIIGQFMVMTISFVTFFAAMYFVHGFKLVSWKGAIIYFILMYVIAGGLLMLAHAIADLAGRFNVAYAIVMCLYFFLMFVSGFMGVRYKDMPKPLQMIADQVVLSPFGEHSYEIWQDKLTNYSSIIQPLIVLLVVGVLLLVAASYKRKKI